MEKKFFYFPCPYCYSKQKANIKHIGKTYRCKKCKNKAIIPPLIEDEIIKIEKVILKPKLSESLLVITCPYCNLKQEISQKYRGIIYNCKRCNFDLKIYNPSLKSFKLITDKKILKANLKDFTQIKVELKDNLNLGIPNKEIILKIDTPDKQIKEYELKTNEDGIAKIKYQSNKYSGETKIKAYIKENPNIKANAVIKEIEGIEDGRVEIKHIYSEYEEYKEFIESKFILKNLGTQEIEIKSIIIQDEEIIKVIEKKEIKGNIKLSAKEKKEIELKLKQLENNVSNTLPLKIEIYYLNLFNNKSLKQTFHLELNIKIIPKLYFNIESFNKNIEKAGEPFYLKIYALRDNKLDKNFNDNLNIEIKPEENLLINFPKILELSFKEGIAITPNIFNITKAKKVNLFIYILDEKYELELIIKPNKLEKFKCLLNKTYVNKSLIETDEKIILLDKYNNKIEDFSQEITIELEKGEILTKEGEKLNKIIPLNGEINLKETIFKIEDISKFPFITNIAIKYKDIIHKEKIKIEPSCAKIIVKEVFHSKISEQGFTEDIKFLLKNEGDSDFKVETALLKFFKEDKSYYKYLISYKVELLENNPDDLIIKGNRETTIKAKVYIKEDAPIGDTFFNTSVGGQDIYYGETKFFDNKDIYKWHIEPKGRIYKISTQNNNKEKAGTLFSLILKTYYKDKLDPTYEGEKEVNFDIITEEKEYTPKKLKLNFIKGVAETPKDFKFFKTNQTYKIKAIDKGIGGAEGEITQIKIIPSEINDIDIINLDTQINHKLFKGENKILILDNYKNHKYDFNNTIDIFIKEYEKEEKFINTIKCTNGELDLNNKIKVDIDYKNLNKDNYIILKYKNKIEKKYKIKILPLAKSLTLENFTIKEKLVEQGEKITLNLELYNLGETQIDIKEINILILTSIKELLTQQNKHYTQDLILSPFKSLKINLNIEIPKEERYIGEIILCPQIKYKDIYYDKENQYTFLKFNSLKVEPIDRIFQITLNNTKINTDNPFSLLIETKRKNKIDPTFNGVKKIYIEPKIIKNKNNNSSNNKEKYQIPSEIEVNFKKGIGKTQEIFQIYKTDIELKIEMKYKGKGRARGEIIINKIEAGELSSFYIELDDQIANLPFRGNFSITALDKYDNIIKNFDKDVYIEALNGDLERKGHIPAKIDKKEFNQGKVNLNTSEFKYITKYLSKAKKEKLIFYTSTLCYPYEIVITPEPAKLEILDIEFPEIVQWEEEVVIKTPIKNKGGSNIEIVNTYINFFKDDKKVEESNFFIENQYPEVIFSENSIINSIVRIEKDAPVGKYNKIEVSILYRDIFYNTLDRVNKIKEEGWRVEPRGRKLIGEPTLKPRAWDSFGLKLKTVIENKIDPTYEGKHILWCGCLKEFPEDIKPPIIPNTLELEFKKGEAQTENIFTFFHAEENIPINFLEQSIGGVEGEIKVTIYKERLSHFIKRKYEQFISLIKNNPVHTGIICIVIFLFFLLYIHYILILETQKIKIIKIQGKIRVDGKEKKEGDIIRAKQKIEISENGYCILQMTNGSIIKLKGATNIYPEKLGIPFLSTTYSPELDIIKGDIIYKSNEKIKEKPNLKISYAKLNIESKFFRLNVYEKKSSISVFEGKIELSAKGKKVKINAGKGASVKKGEPPTDPVNLPSIPIFLLPKPNDTIKTKGVLIKWTQIKKISHYVLEICEKDKFPIPVSIETVIKNFIKIRYLKNNYYKCQVSSINLEGFASPPSKPLIFFHNPPYPTQELHIEVFSKLNKQKILNPLILINNEKFIQDKEYKIGKYRIIIRKKGYKEVKKEIELKDKEEPLNIQIYLEPQPRKIKYNIFTDIKNLNIENKIKDYIIYLNNKKYYKLPEFLYPGKYELIINLAGFNKYQNIFKVEPDNTPLNLDINLISKYRKIIFKIKPNKEEYIKYFKPTIEIIKKFNDTIKIENIKNKIKLKPGVYNINIKANGFKKVVDILKIEPSDKIFVYKKILYPKKREITINAKINYPNYNPIIHIFDNNNKLTFHKRTTKIKLIPKLYTLEINCQGFFTIKDKLNIIPLDNPLQKNYILKPKPVKIKLNLKYSYPPLNPKLDIKLINTENNKIINLVQQNKTISINPGKYKIKIKKYGYKTIEKEIIITPTEKIEIINLVLQPKKVKIYPYVIDKNRNLEGKIIKIEYNKKLLFPPFKILPGEYKIKIFFKKYEPITKNIKITPSEDLYKIYNSLEDYPTFIFKLEKKQITIDGITYKINIYADNNKIPKDMIKFHSFGNYCEFQASNKTKQIKIELGYYYGISPINNLENIELDNINIQKLIEHLNKLSISQKINRLKEIIINEEEKIIKLKKQDKIKILKILLNLNKITQKKLTKNEEKTIKRLINKNIKKDY